MTTAATNASTSTAPRSTEGGRAPNAVVGTASRWAWNRVQRSHGLDAAHRLTLLAAADLLDLAAQSCGRDMFHHDVLDQAVIGFDAADLTNRLGVTEQTAVRYCRKLVSMGLLDTGSTARRFTLPARVWAAATT